MWHVSGPCRLREISQITRTTGLTDDDLKGWVLGGTNGDGGAGESGSLVSGRGVGATRDGTGKGVEWEFVGRV